MITLESMRQLWDDMQAGCVLFDSWLEDCKRYLTLKRKMLCVLQADYEDAGSLTPDGAITVQHIQRWQATKRKKVETCKRQIKEAESWLFCLINDGGGYDRAKKR